MEEEGLSEEEVSLFSFINLKARKLILVNQKSIKLTH